MRRTFISVLSAIVCFFMNMPTASAMVLKDVDAQPGVPRTGVVIVAVTSYIGDWETEKLGPTSMVDDAYAKRLAEQLMAKPGVHYVALLTGSEATASGMTTVLQKAADEKLDFLVFSYRGFGLGADAHASCFVTADWDHQNPFATCLLAKKVAPLVTAAAPRRLVLLDASTPSPDITVAVKPTRSAPPRTTGRCKATRTRRSCRPEKTERYTVCNSFTPMFAAVVNQGRPEAALTFGDLTGGIAAIASTPPGGKLPQGVSACTPPIVPSVDATWFSDVVLIPAVDVPKAPDPTVVMHTVPPLPTEPLKAPKAKPLSTPTVASLVTTGGVCGSGRRKPRVRRRAAGGVQRRGLGCRALPQWRCRPHCRRERRAAHVRLHCGNGPHLRRRWCRRVRPHVVLRKVKS